MKVLLLSDNDFEERTGKYYYSERIRGAIPEIPLLELKASKSFWRELLVILVPRLFTYTLPSQIRNYGEIKEADLIIVDHLRNSFLPLILNKRIILVQHNIEFENLRSLKFLGMHYILFYIESCRLELLEKIIMKKAELVSFISYADFLTYGRDQDFWLPPYFE